MLGVVLQKFPEQLVAQWAEMVSGLGWRSVGATRAARSDEMVSWSGCAWCLSDRPGDYSGTCEQWGSCRALLQLALSTRSAPHPLSVHCRSSCLWWPAW